MTSRIVFWRGLRWTAAVLLAWVPAQPGYAQGPQAPARAAAAAEPADSARLREELARLRREFEAIRDAYSARLAALEAQLNGAARPAPAVEPPPIEPVPELSPAPAQAAGAAAAPPGDPPPAGAPGPPEPGPQAVTPAAASSAGKIFNPDIAVVGNFLGAAGRNAREETPSLELNEAEVSLQAVVDPYARADFFLSASPEGLELEEGFVTLTSLPAGLLAKVGKLKAQFGKVNTLHPHNLPWTDAPLVMRNLLGGAEGISDSGVSISKLIVNPVLFLEATGEVYRGNAGPFQGTARRDVSWLGRLRAYRDLTEGTNLDVGTSFMTGRNDAGVDTRTRLFGIDATVRYRPLRRAIYRRFLGRTELVWSRRGGNEPDAAAFGMYASGEFQFARRWFAGLRYDRSRRVDVPALTDRGSSLLLTYRPSEFSQIRGQYRRIRYGEAVTSNELLFQVLFSIGAHGAHVF